MNLIEVGSWGYQVGGMGIFLFTAIFLFAVRWQTDLLGRMLAAILVIISAIFLTGGYRLLNPSSDTDLFLLWRAILYVSFGLVMWGGFVTFIWSQFFAPRVKQHRTTRRENHEPQSSVAAGRRNPDDRLHGDPGGDY